MSQEDIFINGELLRLRREARGWVLADLATRACMSVKQIRQLEEGGMSSFYSAAVKMTSAKKVGALLGLSAEEVFAQEAALSTEPESVEPETALAAAEALATDIKTTQSMPQVQEVVVQAETASTTTNASVPPAAVASVSVVDEPKSKTSLWVITALFAAALGVAAYMQPQDEPVVEAAPPIQALPADVVDPASSASAADVPASPADVVALPASASSSAAVVGVAVANVPKQASSASGVASAPRVAAPVVSVVAPVIARPASTVTPTASSASKAP